MENDLTENPENEMQQPAASYSRMIDGKMFVVRVFFPHGPAETMQEKTERMLKMDILKTIHNPLR